MKKYLVIAGLLFPMVLFAQKSVQPLTDPDVNCKEFLMSPVVMDQVKQEALHMPDTALYEVIYHQDKDYCDLTVKDRQSGKTYEFTSKNADNFEFDSQQRIFELKLYPKDNLNCENTVAGDYEDVTASFIDADYDFPYVTGQCDASNTNTDTANQPATKNTNSN